ncbi:MAG TPA: hypothetical protein PLJ20_03965 [Candidatus Contendobacter sp.]|nr:hypothetical protein [Candidatus Contendobacter sp.]
MESLFAVIKDAAGDCAKADAAERRAVPRSYFERLLRKLLDKRCRNHKRVEIETESGEVATEKLSKN